MLTVSTSEHQCSAAMRYGAKGFLTKDLSPDALVKRSQRVRWRARDATPARGPTRRSPVRGSTSPRTERVRRGAGDPEASALTQVLELLARSFDSTSSSTPSTFTPSSRARASGLRKRTKWFRPAGWLCRSGLIHRSLGSSAAAMAGSAFRILDARSIWFPRCECFRNESRKARWRGSGRWSGRPRAQADAPPHAADAHCAGR